MYRRTVLRGVASAIVLAGAFGDLQAQQPGKIFRVGVLVNQGVMINGKPNPQVETLRAGLAQLGYVEGADVIFEPRYPAGQLDRLPGFAAELVSLGVDVIVAYGGPPTNAARKATTTIPIVVALVADPVAIGVATTLERPSGNITGVTNNDAEFADRQMALLKELFPKLSRIAILSDPNIPGADASGFAPIERANVAAARAAGFTPQVLKVSSPNPDLEGAFKAMAGESAEALVVLEVPSVFTIAKSVAELGVARRVPTMLWGGQGDAGGLMSYGANIPDLFRRAATYVDKILKGAKPADLPVEQPTRFELVINLKTAKALGLTIPPSLLLRADEVIQ